LSFLLDNSGFLVRQRTQVKNRIPARLSSVNLLFPRSDLYGRAGRAWLATVPLARPMRAETPDRRRIQDARRPIPQDARRPI
jgi:hypothetical protein